MSKLWDRDEVRITLGRMVGDGAKLIQARVIIDDLIGAATKAGDDAAQWQRNAEKAATERDQLKALHGEHDTVERRRADAEMTYRLPDWLNGLPVTEVRDTGRTGDNGPIADVRCTRPDGGYVWVSLDRAALVDVRLPSIDDPVTLPLLLPGTYSEHPVRISKSAGVAHLWIDTTGRNLQPDEAREVARALWQIAAPATVDGA